MVIEENMKHTNSKYKNILNKYFSKNDFIVTTPIKQWTEGFRGQDIDIIARKDLKIKIDSCLNAIVRDDEISQRVLFLSDSTLLSVDIEKYFIIDSIQSEKYIKYNDIDGLTHLTEYGYSHYKMVKYFKYGFYNKAQQINELASILDTLSKSDRGLIFRRLEEEGISKVLIRKFEMRVLDEEFWAELTRLRNLRNKSRRAFAGKIHMAKLILNIRFLRALLPFKVRASRFPLSAVAIVGNDGAGKTTLCNEIIRHAFKLDPLHIDMKAENPYTPLWRILRPVFKNVKFNIDILFIKKILKYIIGFGDIVDKYIRYKVGVAWADAGFGITLFERYPTDRVRGEYPSGKLFTPVEQYFPMPDSIILIDVEEKDSLERKRTDGHTQDEMKSKRLNYLSLMSEISGGTVIPVGYSLSENYIQTMKIIFETSHNKAQKSRDGYVWPRAKWVKNKERLLYGNANERTQRENL